MQWRGMANTCRAVAAAIVDRRSRDGQGFEPLSPPARYIYGSRHTRMCVSSLAEAVAPRDSCRPHAAQARLESSCQQGESKFWLVALIQDCRVLTAQETASAKCWLKIHWQDGAFPDKIRDEKRKLPNTDNFAEQSKDLDLEKLAVDLETGGLVYGMVDVAPDSFPINIDAIFLNQISAERISSLCWTKYDKDAGLVSVSGCAVDPMPCGSIAHPYAFCLF